MQENGIWIPESWDSKAAWCGLHTRASQCHIVHFLCSRDRGWDMSEWYLAVSKAHTHDGEDVPKELEIRTCRRPQGPSGGS